MTVYGVGGVEADTLAARNVCRCLRPVTSGIAGGSDGIRSSDLPDPASFDGLGLTNAPMPVAPEKME